MLKHFITILLCSLALTVSAQDEHNISGAWFGVSSNYAGEKHRLLIVLEKSRHGYKGLLKSPDRTDMALPMDSVDYTAGTLRFRVNVIDLSYKGGWDAANQRFNGTLTQAGQQAPLQLSKDTIHPADVYRRPQQPHGPVGYREEQVMFSSLEDENIALAGTFTRPPDSVQHFPVVILLGDAGPQDRDETMFGHKPFAVLADYFTRRGIAVLRWDDRGAGSSKGSYDNATYDDMAADVRAAIAYIRQRKDIDHNQVGLLGHGEGAAIAAMVASRPADSIAFLISLAGPGLPALQQQEAQMAQMLRAAMPQKGDSSIGRYIKYTQPWFKMLATETDPDAAQQKSLQLLQEMYRKLAGRPMTANEQAGMEQLVALQTTPHSLSAIRFDPAQYYQKVKCPVLALNGSRDLVMEATRQLPAIEKAVLTGGNQQVTAHSLDGLNHLFQPCKTCTAEYADIDQTIDPAVPDFIARWIMAVVNLSASPH